MTFYLSEAMRNRARAAYRQTSFDERDSSWSEMLNKALLAEVQRRELAYNDGHVFVGNEDPLTPRASDRFLMPTLTMRQRIVTLSAG